MFRPQVLSTTPITQQWRPMRTRSCSDLEQLDVIILAALVAAGPEGLTPEEIVAALTDLLDPRHPKPRGSQTLEVLAGLRYKGAKLGEVTGSWLLR